MVLLDFIININFLGYKIIKLDCDGHKVSGIYDVANLVAIHYIIVNSSNTRMAIKRCCIDSCKSSTIRKEDYGVTFHKFPKEITLCNIWIAVTHSKHNTELPTYVCSRHFCKTDFEIYKDSKYILKSGIWKNIV